MAEKISMLLVKVDLDCHKCYDKMRKILCKLQDDERIRTIAFDDKSNTIAVAGPFVDPQSLARKIRCRGGKTVKDVQIVDVGGGFNGNGKPPPKVADHPPSPPELDSDGEKGQKEKLPAAASEHVEPSPPPQPQPSPPEPAPTPPPEEISPSPPPQPATPDKGVGASSTTPAIQFHEEDKPMPKPKPAELEAPKTNPPVECDTPPAALPQPPHVPKPRPPPPPCPKPPEPYPGEYVIPPVEIPSWPGAPVGPCGCPCCAPCYQGYYEGCRCNRDGSRSVYGCSAARPVPSPAAWCGYYRGCRIINEEDPNAPCSVM